MIKNPGCLECIGNYTSQLSTNQYNVKLEDFLVAQLINLEFDPSCRHRSIQRVGKYNQKIQALRITFVAFHKFLFNKFYLPACFTFVAFHMFLFTFRPVLPSWRFICFCLLTCRLWARGRFYAPPLPQPMVVAYEMLCGSPCW